MMADYILQNTIEDVELIQNFTAGGYAYSAADSDDKQWTFSRRQLPSK
jgi:cytoplasmic iron level regulating protein YaaA (DUF328/UPF0246 family)